MYEILACAVTLKHCTISQDFMLNSSRDPKVLKDTEYVRLNFCEMCTEWCTRRLDISIWWNRSTVWGFTLSKHHTECIYDTRKSSIKLLEGNQKGKYVCKRVEVIDVISAAPDTNSPILCEVLLPHLVGYYQLLVKLKLHTRWGVDKQHSDLWAGLRVKTKRMTLQTHQHRHSRLSNRHDRCIKGNWLYARLVFTDADCSEVHPTNRQWLLFCLSCDQKTDGKRRL